MNQVSDRLSWLRHEMDQLFNEVLPGWSVPATVYPPVNLWEDDSNFYLEAELPGLTIGDLDLTVAGQEVTIRGERKAEAKEGWACHRRERPAGKFSRVIECSAPIDPDQVQASFKHGVLSVTLPKAAAAKPRKIEVRRIEKK